MRKGSWKLILWSSTFIFTMFFIISLAGDDVAGVVSSGSAEETTPPDLNTGECDVDGWTDVIGAVKCAVSKINQFFKLTTVTSDFKALRWLVLIPLGAALTWVILEVIRGT